MRILFAIIGAQALLMMAGEAENSQRCAVRSELVGDDGSWHQVLVCTENLNSDVVVMKSAKGRI
jgi:hypothetical protein